LVYDPLVMLIEFPHTGHAIQLHYDVFKGHLLVQIPEPGKITRDGVLLTAKRKDGEEALYALLPGPRQEGVQYQDWTFTIRYRDRGKTREVILKLFCLVDEEENEEEWQADIELGGVLIDLSLDDYEADAVEEDTLFNSFPTDLFGHELVGKA
jgi:DNA-binding cell septation regulator SpoVG